MYILQQRDETYQRGKILSKVCKGRREKGLIVWNIFVSESIVRQSFSRLVYSAWCFGRVVSAALWQPNSPTLPSGVFGKVPPAQRGKKYFKISARRWPSFERKMLSVEEVTVTISWSWKKNRFVFKRFEKKITAIKDNFHHRELIGTHFFYFRCNWNHSHPNSHIEKPRQLHWNDYIKALF